MFDLDQFLPYLVNRAGAKMAVRFAEDLRPHGVSLQEWRVLAVLAARGEQRMSMLAEQTAIERTTLSRIVGKMSGRGLVLQQGSKEDRREVRIALSSKGQSRTKAILPLAKHYQETALKGVSADHARLLNCLLAQIFANIADL